ADDGAAPDAVEPRQDVRFGEAGVIALHGEARAEEPEELEAALELAVAQLDDGNEAALAVAHVELEAEHGAEETPEDIAEEVAEPPFRLGRQDAAGRARENPQPADNGRSGWLPTPAPTCSRLTHHDSPRAVVGRRTFFTSPIHSAYAHRNRILPCGTDAPA